MSFFWDTPLGHPLDLGGREKKVGIPQIPNRGGVPERDPSKNPMSVGSGTRMTGIPDPLLGHIVIDALTCQALMFGMVCMLGPCLDSGGTQSDM